MTEAIEMLTAYQVRSALESFLTEQKLSNQIAMHSPNNFIVLVNAIPFWNQSICKGEGGEYMVPSIDILT